MAMLSNGMYNKRGVGCIVRVGGTSKNSCYYYAFAIDAIWEETGLPEPSPKLSWKLREFFWSVIVGRRFRLGEAGKPKPGVRPPAPDEALDCCGARPPMGPMTGRPRWEPPRPPSGCPGARLQIM